MFNLCQWNGAVRLSSNASFTIPIQYNIYYIGLISSQGSGPRACGIYSESNNTINIYMSQTGSHTVGYTILCI